MILAQFGDPEDLTAAYLAFVAERRGWEVVILAEGEMGASWMWDVRDDGVRLTGGLETPRGRLALDDLTGAGCRMHPSPGQPTSANLDVSEESWLVAERRQALVHLVSTLPCPVANRPRRGRANASKPYQMRELEANGFRVPRWITTNNTNAADDFFHSCADGAIYKSCSGLRSHVRRVGDELNVRLSAGTTPVILQEFVPGDDVRVHVVGDRCFGSLIQSSGGVDYRFDEVEHSYSTIDVPEELALLCAAERRREGLLIAGLDFRVRDGQWWCLESNPVPTFLPYEMSTGQPIADAILDQMQATNSTDSPS